MTTNKEKFFKLHKIDPSDTLSIDDIARISGFPKGALQESYNRGVGAWKTNPESVRLQRDFSKNPNMKRYPRSARLTKEQWGMARAYAFVMMTDKVFKGADRDIAEKFGLLPKVS
jgi:hypothetical protein